MRETRIEQIIRENTPDFVVGTSHLVDTYHTYNFQCKVFFNSRNAVIKKDTLGKLKAHKSAWPDFVLQNVKQMQSLNEVIEAASKGEFIADPFRRNTGWYIEVFGEYWHSEKAIGIPIEEHVKQVTEAYENSGNHVLILWENEILNHFEEIVRPKLNRYIAQFTSCNKVDSRVKLKLPHVLSDTTLICLNDAKAYRELDLEERKNVVDDLVFCYRNIVPYDNIAAAHEDLFNLNKKIKEGIKGRCIFGNRMINHFIKSRLDAKVKSSRSLNEIWHDEDLMRKCIDWQFMNEDGVHNVNRFLAAMTHAEGFRVASNLNHGIIVNRIRPYAVPGGIFYDPCAGWGGRMIAAYALGMRYVAIDANKKLISELRRMARYMNYDDVEIHYGDSSDPVFVNRILKGRNVDLAFTCPPYFDEEIYSDDEEQSIVKYPLKKEWEEMFLTRMIKNTLSHLNLFGNFIISVDEKVDLKNVPGIKIEIISSSMRKTEDDYFIIKNASEEATAGHSFVQCKLCGEHFRAIRNHLTKVHHISAEEYLSRFPGENLICSEESKRIGQTNSTKFGGKKKKYNKRVAYLLPDGTYTGITHKYKKEWKTSVIDPKHIFDANEVGYVSQADRPYQGEEGVDYVSCKICGVKKGNLCQHLKKQHGLSKEEYKEKYHAEVYSEKAKTSQHLCTVHRWETERAKKNLQ